MKARAKEICILIIFVLKETENTSPCFYRVGVDHLTFKLVGGWILKALTCKRKQIHALEICWKKKFKYVQWAGKNTDCYPEKKISWINTSREKNS